MYYTAQDLRYVRCGKYRLLLFPGADWLLDLRWGSWLQFRWQLGWHLFGTVHSQSVSPPPPPSKNGLMDPLKVEPVLGDELCPYQGEIFFGKLPKKQKHCGWVSRTYIYIHIYYIQNPLHQFMDKVVIVDKFESINFDPFLWIINQYLINHKLNSSFPHLIYYLPNWKIRSELLWLLNYICCFNI